MTRLEELTEMILRGWGDVPQKQIPEDWRTKWGPEVVIEKRREAMRRWRFRQRAGLPRLRNLEAWKERRNEYLHAKEWRLNEACPFPPGSQFRFPFSFSDAG